MEARVCGGARDFTCYRFISKLQTLENGTLAPDLMVQLIIIIIIIIISQIPCAWIDSLLM